MTRRMLLLAAGLATAAVVAALVWLTPAGRALRGVWAAQPQPDVAYVPSPRPLPPDEADHAVPPRGEVVIDSRRQQLMGVRIVPVQKSVMSAELRAAGVVRFDETRQAEISTKVDGWIRDLQANFTGRRVARGDVLFSLYSPALVAAQNEYLLALHGQEQAAQADVPNVLAHSERILDAARERLLRWDLTLTDVRDLERRGRPSETVPFLSTADGVIVEKMAVEGKRVMAGETLFRVADLSVVCIEADVPEQDMALVRVGLAAQVELDAYPGETLLGRTVYIYPTVDEQTRTAKVRFQFANRDGRLRPGMFATVRIAGRESPALMVPPDAVLDAGRDQVVFVALGDGRFEPRPVAVGRRTRDAIEITRGLAEGEQVAAGAAFFLDSESQLRAAMQSYAAAPGAAPAPGSAERLDISFRTEPDPPRFGENQFEVSVRDAAGQPIADAEVVVTFFMPAMPTMNMPAMRSQAKLPAAGNGVYRGRGEVLMGGRWDVTIQVSRGGRQIGSRQLTVVTK